MLGKQVMAGVCLVSLMGAGCTEDSNSMTDASVDGAVSGLESVILTHEGLETLAGGYHYEGWAIIDGAPVSTGKFNVDASGAVVDLDGIAIADARFDVRRDLTVATQFVLTIETAGDVDITPADSHLLAGTLDGDTAVLTVDGGTEAFPSDFSDAAGTFGLATPTDGMGDPANERSGVWFVDFESLPNPSLTLPTLPTGWVYEGWVVIGSSPISTGRFLAVDMADDLAPHSGPMGGPPAPGEDLLVNPPAGEAFPVDLRSATIVVSVEPEPDDGPAPFTLKPLVGQVPNDAEDHQNYMLETQPQSRPLVAMMLVP